MARGRKFKRLKNWLGYPKRRARNSFYNCKLCTGTIVHQQDYYDAGNNVRVCEPCAVLATDQWKEQQR